MKDGFCTDSWITEVAYDYETKKLSVLIDESLYEFCNVPKEIFESFKNVESKGRFYNQLIKNNFKC